MADTFKQLFQHRENGTTAISVYQAGANTETLIKSIKMVNTSGVSAVVTIYHDDDGNTFDESTAIFKTTLAALETLVDTSLVATDNATGEIAVQTSVANAVTFTAFGMERTT